MSTTVLHLRVNEDDLKRFKDACGLFHRDHNDVLRELIKAFADGRIKITPTDGQNKQMLEIYTSTGAEK